jgi:hypothetical protein
VNATINIIVSEVDALTMGNPTIPSYSDTQRESNMKHNQPSKHLKSYINLIGDSYILYLVVVPSFPSTDPMVFVGVVITTNITTGI